MCFGTRDAIKLLTSLNEITCDLVAGASRAVPQYCFQKSFKQSRWKTFAVLEFLEQQEQEREKMKKKTPQRAESNNN